MENWKTLSEEYPKPYRLIKILIDNEVIETRTYLHQHNLMIQYKDGNPNFQGFSPKLLDQSVQWCYNDTLLT